MIKVAIAVIFFFIAIIYFRPNLNFNIVETIREQNKSTEINFHIKNVFKYTLTK